jgi:hypothetical protein
MMQRRSLVALALVPFAALAVTACRSSSNTNPTPTAAASAVPSITAAPSATPPAATSTPTSAIRSMDLKSSAAVKKLLDDTGGQFVQGDVKYADLTGGGAENAIVPISSGGTLGDLAFVVLALSGSDTTALLSEFPPNGHGLAVAVVAGQLVETEALPGPDDPECCPTSLRVTTYKWDGTKLAVESQKTVPNPNAGSKGTPSGQQASP